MGIFITHRIAGPMFALVRHFRVIQTGRLTPPLRVRASDELKYVVRNFNDMLEYLLKVTARDKAVLDDAAARLTKAGADAETIGMLTALSAEYAVRLVGGRTEMSEGGGQA